MATENIVLTKNDVKEASSLEEFYQALKEKNIFAQQVLLIMDFCNSVLNFDAFSDNCIFSDIDNFLQKICNYANNSAQTDKNKDILFHLVSFIGRELDSIMQSPRERIFRNYENVPFYQAKEMDSKCLQVLARYPGRTIREKLTNHKTITTVKRRFTCDTLENQLFKLLLKRLMEALSFRKDYYSYTEYNNYDPAVDLISKISFWLHGETADEIGPWRNNPPNNVLLQDRRYRKVWLGWSLLRNIDDSIKHLFLNRKLNISSFIFWNVIAELSTFKGVRFFQKPIIFNNAIDNYFQNNEVEGVYVNSKLNPQEIIIKKNDNFISCRFGPASLSLIIDDDVIESILNDDKINHYNLADSNLGDIIKASVSLLTSAIIKAPISRNGKQTFLNIESNIAALDATYSCPKLAFNKEEIEYPFRLMCQHWQSYDDNVTYKIDNKFSKGIVLKDKDYKINTYTLKSVLNRNFKQKNKQIEAAISIANILSKDLKVNTLLYTFPDVYDDFELEALRIGLNSSFPSAISVPESIANITSLIQENVFKMENSIVFLHFDITDIGISVTPIHCIYNNNLEKEVPETKGYQLIRYPTSEYPIKKAIHNIFVKNCSQELNNKIIRLFDIEGMESISDDVSFLNEGKEHPYIKSSKIKIPISENYVTDFINNLGKSITYTRIYCIGSKKYLDFSEIESNYQCLHLYNRAAYGCLLINNFENKLKHEVLWYDYLPNLAMQVVFNGEKRLLKLTENKKIKPVANVPITIDIPYTFTFPPKKKFYHFPLVKGAGKQTTNFEAYIKEDFFPLDKPLECRLDLTYTYGAENAFQLSFIPIRNSEIPRINVEWKKSDEIPQDLDNLMIPPYPPIKTEKELENFVNNKGETVNLLEEFENQLTYLMSNPVIAYTNCEYVREEKLKNGFSTFVYISVNSTTNKFFANNNLLNDIKKVLNTEKTIYLEKFPDGKTRLTVLRNFNKKMNYTKFLMYTLFNEGRDLSSFNISFQQKCRSFITYVESILYKDNFVKEIKQHCVNLCCAITDELPKSLVDYILNPEHLKMHSSALPYLIKSCSLPWQKNLLQQIISTNESFSVNALASAVWKKPYFVKLLTPDQINYIVNKKLFYLRLISKSLDKSQLPDSKSLKYCGKTLELLLGLMRTRLVNDDGIKQILAPKSPNNQKLLTYIKNIENHIEQSNFKFEFKSFLLINIDKSKLKPNVHPLIIANRLYLESEDLNSGITISGFNEEE